MSLIQLKQGLAPSTGHHLHFSACHLSVHDSRQATSAHLQLCPMCPQAGVTQLAGWVRACAAAWWPWHAPPSAAEQSQSFHGV